MGTLSDIRERKQTEHIQLIRNQILGLIAMRSERSEILRRVIEVIEEQGSGIICSIHVPALNRVETARHLHVGTARLNGVEPQSYLRHVLARIAEHPINRIDELLPWNVASRLPAIAPTS